MRSIICSNNETLFSGKGRKKVIVHLKKEEVEVETNVIGKDEPSEPHLHV
jgi:hypothetical protein